MPEVQLSKKFYEKKMRGPHRPKCNRTLAVSNLMTERCGRCSSPLRITCGGCGELQWQHPGHICFNAEFLRT